MLKRGNSIQQSETNKCRKSKCKTLRLNVCPIKHIMWFTHLMFSQEQRYAKSISRCKGRISVCIWLSQQWRNSLLNVGIPTKSKQDALKLCWVSNEHYGVQKTKTINEIETICENLLKIHLKSFPFIFIPELSILSNFQIQEENRKWKITTEFMPVEKVSTRST
jgi:hypothetical protein